tara:strand:- start:869 stop:1138 length:270 start_codon:yes stop_codon:yes gene_type:complete
MSNNFNSNSEPKITKPLNKLQRSINKNVMVRLKNDIEYRGKMTNVDAYMNVILNDAEEFADGSLSANFGKVVIRGNNVLFINILPDILM